MTAKMSIGEFYRLVGERREKTGERYGQAMFNAAVEHLGVKGELRAYVTKDNCDPFYNDDKVMDFIDFLEDWGLIA